MKQSKLVYVVGSVIIGIIAVLGILAGLIFGGVIDGTLRQVVFTSGSQTQVYDATTLTNDTWELKSGQLKNGHTAHAVVSGAQTDAGSSANSFVVYILDQNGADVSGDYDIVYRPGTLTVQQRNITVVAKSATHVYDGQPFTCKDYTLSSGSIVDGQKLNLSYVGEIVNVGDCENVVSATVSDQENNDVSANYNITCVKGLLTVTQREITVKSFDINETYNGMPFSSDPNDYTVEKGELVAGQRLSLTINGTQTEAGVSQNTFKTLILDGEDNDVTSNYLVTEVFGTITISKQRIVVASKDASQIYNGMPLTQSEWEIKEGKIATNQELTVTCTGSIIDVGEQNNVFYYVIKDQSGRDVTYNYTVEKMHGVLTVTSRGLHIETYSDKKAYDGTDLFNLGYFIKDYEDLCYGDHIEVLGCTNVLRVDQGAVENKLEIEVKNGERIVTSNYEIVFTYGQLEVYPAPLDIYTGGIIETYNGSSWTCDEAEIIGVSAFDRCDFWATGSQTNVGSSENTYYLSIYDKNGQNSLSNYALVEHLGVITVEPRILHVGTPAITAIYTGEYIEDATPTLLAGTTLPIGHTLQAIDNTKIYRVEEGSVQNEVEYIVMNGEDEVTPNYEINVVFGYLQVLPAPLKIITGSLVETYNGTPWSNNTAIVEGVVPFDVYQILLNTSITNVGQIDNSYELTITDQFGFNSISNYEITEEIGTITVEPISISVTTPTITRPYNGQPLFGKEEGIEIIGAPAPEEQFILVSSGFSQTTVGAITNAFTLVADRDGVDTTANYEITYDYGNLEVTKREVIISSGTTMMMYNAEYQLYENITIHEGLVEELGHVLDVNSVDFGEGFKNVATYENVFDYTKLVFVDSESQDVTENYFVTPIFGEVTIYPKPIEIRTHDATKQYDGTPLTCDKYTVTGDLFENHYLEITITGTRLAPGESLNTFIVTDIIDESSGVPESVYHNYEIKEVCGVLYVFDANSNNDDANTDENTGGEIDEDGEKSPEEIPIYEVTTSVTGRVYLRQVSYGDYIVAPNGKTQWVTGRVYSGGTINPMAFPYLALENYSNANQTVITKLISDAPYVLPYYTDLSTEPTLNDVQLSVDTNGYVVMDRSYLLKYYLKGALTGTAYEQEELDYRKFVYENYTYLPQSTKQAMLNVISQNGLSADDANIIQKVADLVSNYVSYSYEFHYEGDIAKYFFTQAKTGICQHYATAATALFRALNIPARYTTGYVGNVYANTPSIIKTPGHAWVEVYVDGFGWIPVEVTGTMDQEQEESSQPSSGAILVKPYDVYVQGSTGTTLTYTNTLLEGSELAKLCQEKGYTYSFKVEGRQIGIGKTKTKITDFVLYDENGVPIEEGYTFNFKEGVLQVYVQELTIMTASLSEYYDGRNHFIDITSPDAITVDYGRWGKLIDGHTFGKVSFAKSIKDVGSVSNTFKQFSIIDALGNNVTDFYKINFIYGRLTIKSRSLTVTADSATAKLADLNGEPLTCDTYTIVSNIDGLEPLAEGHVIVVKIESSISKVGRTANQISEIKILDEYGVDVTSNYNIVRKSGTLRITN